MNRLFSNVINLILTISVGIFLSGCVATRIPEANSSPWKSIELKTEANPLDISFVDDKKGFLVGKS